MRMGCAPPREKVTDHLPARVTVCVLVFIPEQVGYYAYRFDVLKRCRYDDSRGNGAGGSTSCRVVRVLCF